MNAQSKFSLKKIFQVREVSVIMILLLAIGVITALNPVFISGANMRAMLIGCACDILIVIAMTQVLVCGMIDLSVGAVMSMCAVTCGGLYLGGMDIWLAALCAIAVGMFFGFVSGMLVGRLGLIPFITTLGMQQAARGVSYILTEGSPLSLGQLPDVFKNIGGGDIFAGIPMLVVIVLVFAIIGDFYLRKTELARKIFYVGSNQQAARLSGMSVANIKLLVLITSATLAALAGVLSVARFRVATPTSGLQAETRAISAAVIGGTSMGGGEGSVFVAVIGVLLLNVINSAIVILGVSVYWQEAVQGVILLLAVSIDLLGTRRKFKVSTK